jgi:hypothetical protein
MFMCVLVCGYGCVCVRVYVSVKFVENAQVNWI